MLPGNQSFYRQIASCVLCREVYCTLSAVGGSTVDYSKIDVFFFTQFFDSDGDGVVSEADLSDHIPFRSLPYHLHDNDHVPQVGSDREAALPNKMNMGM